MRSSDDDPDGVKKFLAFCSGFSLYLINVQLKGFRSESASLRRLVFQYLDSESVQHGIGVRPGKNLGIIRRRQRGLCVVVKDEGCAFPQLVQAVDRWQYQPQDSCQPASQLVVKLDHWRVFGVQPLRVP